MCEMRERVVGGVGGGGGGEGGKNEAAVMKDPSAG